jgi:hypothetical protein
VFGWPSLPDRETIVHFFVAVTLLVLVCAIGLTVEVVTDWTTPAVVGIATASGLWLIGPVLRLAKRVRDQHRRVA